MVDPHPTHMGHAGAQHGDEGAETRGNEGARGEGGEPPGLPERVEQVRRCADGEADQHVVRRAPALAAAAVAAHRQIADEAHGHAGRAGGRLRARQATRRRPLQEGVEFHLRSVLAGKGRYRRARRIAVLAGPGAPVPAVKVRAPDMSMQRLEARVVLEGLALGAAEVRIGGNEIRARRQFGVEQAAQQGEARRAGAHPIHQRSALAGGEYAAEGERVRGLPRGIGAEQAGGVHMQHVEEKAARRRIGAEMVRIGREGRMHRAQHRRRGTGPRGVAHEVGQGGEVADAAVARSLQPIELDPQTPKPGPFVSGGVGDGKAPLRRDGERHVQPARLQPVIAGHVERGQVEPAALALALHQPTILQRDAPAQRPAAGQGHAQGRTHIAGHERRDGNRRVPEAVKALARQRIGLRRQAERTEDGAQGMGRHRLRAAEGIVPVRRDAGRAREVVEGIVHGCVQPWRGVRKRVASGGRVRERLKGRPWLSMASASTAPPLPMPEPS